MIDSYSYSIPETTQPQFLYVEQGIAKSSFPKDIQEIMNQSKPQVAKIDIEAIFGSAGLKTFRQNHYLKPILYFQEA